MHDIPFPPSGAAERVVTITRVAQSEWHAVDDGLVAGRGHASHRPDGRLFVSVDAWSDTAFDRLAQAMLAELPAPLYTVVDEADLDSTAAWRRAGFDTARREWDHLVPTDPRLTGLGPLEPPPGVRILPLGQAREEPLLELDRAVRAEVAATAGWHTMPAEVLPRPACTTVADPAKYAVAVRSRSEPGGPDRYVGLVRLTGPARRPRIGLIAVLAAQRRQGYARALLAHVLGSLHRAGVESAVAEVDASNTAALALFDGIGARRVGSSLELVRR